jgi:predicted phosphodiesterase
MAKHPAPTGEPVSEQRREWKPGDPRRWAPTFQRVEVEPDSDLLVIASDLHAYREPLDAFSAELARLSDRRTLFVNGDLLEGGLDAAYTVEWVRDHAGGRTTRGNHDSAIFGYLALAGEKGAVGDWPADTEMAAYSTLDPQQLAFIADLPGVLEVYWRGWRLRLLHGHFNLHDPDYTFWQVTPEAQLELFHDPAVALTVVSHTHYPFVRERDGSSLANSGSISAPICRFQDPSGDTVNRCIDDPDVSSSDTQSHFLTISEDGPRLNVEIQRFDYDRAALMARYTDRTDLYMPPRMRRAWVMNGQIITAE